ncbi:hypothetical protein DV515_00011782 [Chloebia gouldiae]|uniref:Uncharacterized protein n=1 Tax=Chloebia gouldiae TaxID=44316 RepID=A0A3L8S5A9_CHLGU|nr:hypothetical protein DV515_00011782 [Chloebia gouldiae]
MGSALLPCLLLKASWDGLELLCCAWNGNFLPVPARSWTVTAPQPCPAFAEFVFPFGLVWQLRSDGSWISVDKRSCSTQIFGVYRIFPVKIPVSSLSTSQGSSGNNVLLPCFGVPPEHLLCGEQQLLRVPQFGGFRIALLRGDKDDVPLESLCCSQALGECCDTRLQLSANAARQLIGKDNKDEFDFFFFFSLSSSVPFMEIKNFPVLFSAPQSKQNVPMVLAVCHHWEKTSFTPSQNEEHFGVQRQKTWQRAEGPHVKKSGRPKRCGEFQHERERSGAGGPAGSD